MHVSQRWQVQILGKMSKKITQSSQADRIIAASRVIIVTYSKLNSETKTSQSTEKEKNYLTCVSSQSKQMYRRNNLSFSINLVNVLSQVG